MPPRIMVVDYGMGNLSSLHRAFSRLGSEPVVSSDPGDLAGADKIVLPGVGHFGKAMRNLEDRGLRGPLDEAVLAQRKLVLGICLGAQLMARRSQEGDAAGLGWIAADVVRFAFEGVSRSKVPHIGWNQAVKTKDSPLMRGLADAAEFYFVHAYHFRAEGGDDALAETEYGYRFVSAVERRNVFGVQFHPEKSFSDGEALLANFVGL